MHLCCQFHNAVTKQMIGNCMTVIYLDMWIGFICHCVEEISVKLSCYTLFTHAENACIFRASWAKPRLVTKVKMQNIAFWIEIFLFKNWNRMRQKVETACVTRLKLKVLRRNSQKIANNFFKIFLIPVISKCNYLIQEIEQK